jgi:hypothetical protein
VAADWLRRCPRRFPLCWRAAAPATRTTRTTNRGRAGEAQPSARADRQVAHPGPRAALHRRDHGMPARRTRSTSSPSPNDRAARAPVGRPSHLSNRAASPARSRVGAERCRPPIAAPDTSAPSVGDATTRTSRPCTAAMATGRTTRYRGCAIAVATTATTATTTRSTADRRGTGLSKAGNTTSDPLNAGRADLSG